MSMVTKSGMCSRNIFTVSRPLLTVRSTWARRNFQEGCLSDTGDSLSAIPVPCGDRNELRQSFSTFRKTGRRWRASRPTQFVSRPDKYCHRQEAKPTAKRTRDALRIRELGLRGAALLSNFPLTTNQSNTNTCLPAAGREKRSIPDYIPSPLVLGPRPPVRLFDHAEVEDKILPAEERRPRPADRKAVQPGSGVSASGALSSTANRRIHRRYGPIAGARRRPASTRFARPPG